MPVTILQGDCLDVLRTLPDQSVHCCVTSPPYWGLRDYGTAQWEGGSAECDHKRPIQPRSERERNGLTGVLEYMASKEPVFQGVCGKCGATRKDRQIGLEPTPEAYVAKMVEVFREVRRVLRDDGTCWINLGDSYAGNSKDATGGHEGNSSGLQGGKDTQRNARRLVANHGLKPKDLVGIPWMVAFALRADGWYLRSDIIWAKPNPMPESVRDRPTKAHEYIFLLSKSERYWYDGDAIREPYSEASVGRYDYALQGTAPTCNQINGDIDRRDREKHVRPPNPLGRNKRSVWSITTEPFKEAHFATFPPDLIKPCILAGCPVGGTVLDCFGGSGTTGMVALELGRNAILIELNPAYCKLIGQRTNVTPGLELC